MWVVGELLGGITEPGSSWLDGAPGAAVFYAAASLILLMPWRSWDSGRAGRWLRGVAGVSFCVGAVLQVMPGSPMLTPRGLFSYFAEVGLSGIPSPADAPVLAWANVVPDHAALFNALLVLSLAGLGIALIFNLAPRLLTPAAAALSLAAWWFGQGFGIFGGVGTDPNSGVVVALLLLSAWPWRPRAAVDPGELLDPGELETPVDTEFARAGVLVAVGTAAPTSGSPLSRPFGGAVLACLLVVPLVAAFGLIGEPTSQAAIGASGGVIEMSPIAAPEFVLTDQRGKRIAMRDFRGSLTLVAFLDPECDDSCPLIARQLVNAVQSLGSSASSVSILVVDINPVFNSVRDVAAFTDAHGLTDEPSWHFATGTNAEISNLLAAFGEGVSLPSVGMVGHPQSVYLFDRGGKALAVVNDTASEDLTQSYTDLIASTLRGQL